MSSFYSCLSMLLLSSALVGCTEGTDFADVDLGDEEFRDTLGCANCPPNSPFINDFSLSSLDLSGGPNLSGVTVAGVVSPSNLAYSLGVYDEDLAAFVGNTPVLAGASLVGWDIVLEAGGTELRARIYSRSTVPSWAEGTRPISVYAIADITGLTPTSICPGADANAAAVTILHGETYDSELKQVDQIGSQWITLACIDEAAAKMKRLGYSPGGEMPDTYQPASVAQRNATLKMITADFCGTGESFTAHGTKLRWDNAGHTIIPPQPIMLAGPIEAVWDEHGAMCIGEARLGNEADILQACPSLPDCATFLPTNPVYEWKTWRTAP